MDKEIDIKRIKRKRNNGFCFIIPGVICVAWSIFTGVGTSWYGGYWGIPMILAIFLMVIGFGLVLYNSIKLSK